MIKDHINLSFKRVNQKSDQKHEKLLSDTIGGGVLKGYILLLPEVEALDVSGLELSPTGVVERIVIITEGTSIEKKSILHEISFPGSISDESVDSRVDTYQMLPCMFGYALIIIIHQGVHFRALHPH